jgi:hypothetical protein
MRTLIATISLISMIAGQTAGQPIKCGWASHPPAVQDRIATVSLFRPDRHQSYISPDSAFMVHYDTSGFDAPDLTSTEPDGVPDWVVDVGAALDSIRSLLLALGLDPALPDDDGIFDVYLQDNGGGLYGETIFATSVAGGGWIAYIEMENDFAADENYHTHGLNAARVTCAHEYFHAVQLAQEFKESDVFLYELTSTWFEEVVFPEVNDWVYWFDEAGGFALDPTEDRWLFHRRVRSLPHQLGSRHPEHHYTHMGAVQVNNGPGSDQPGHWIRWWKPHLYLDRFCRPFIFKQTSPELLFSSRPRPDGGTG